MVTLITSARSHMAARGLALWAWDAVSWVGAAALYVVFGNRLSPATWGNLLWFVGVAALFQLMLGLLSRAYLGRSRAGSFEDATATAALVSVSGATAALLSAVTPQVTLPGLAAFMVPMTTLVLQESGRLLLRMAGATPRERRHGDGEVALVYGAGTLGHHLARLVDAERSAPFRIAGYLDDDRSNSYLRVGRYRVIGRGTDLPRLAADHNVAVVVLAIANMPAEFVRTLSKQCRDAGCRLVVIPPVREMVGMRMSLGHLRPVDISDLLGRSKRVDVDLTEASSYITGASVLITGAGGSIGSELARQVHRLGARKLVLLDRDETLLHAVQLSIYGKGLLDTDDIVLCDIRDQAALREVFALHRPEVVFHVAALKHLPMLEQYPQEGWKTNVLGSKNVLQCADEVGVRTLVNVSTDKAADPINVLGKTKRIAERMTAHYSTLPHRRYVSVRFGNVFGSRGSVFHSISSQIEAGGPVTVTHPQVTRFFMSIAEACELVLQAGALGHAGDVMILDMGEPVSILEIAERMIDESGLPLQIAFTGLRPGEKMHEDLFDSVEISSATRSAHPLIRQVAVPPLDPAEINGAQAAARLDALAHGADNRPSH